MTGVNIDRVHQRKPRAGSAYSRAQQFFVDNPDEMLSYEDMQAKFELTHEQLKSLLRDLKKEGVIETAFLAWKRPGFKG